VSVLEFPANESALYDLLRAKFGIGSYDEADANVPWFRARGTEIAKLKSQMKRRRLTIEDLTIAAWFAERDHRPITQVWHLCNIVGEAKRAWRQASQETPHLRRELDAAAAEAHERGDDGWAARLFAADLSTGTVVLEQWRDHMARSQ